MSSLEQSILFDDNMPIVYTWYDERGGVSGSIGVVRGPIGVGRGQQKNSGDVAAATFCRPL